MIHSSSFPSSEEAMIIDPLGGVALEYGGCGRACCLLTRVMDRAITLIYTLISRRRSVFLSFESTHSRLDRRLPL